jgi:hypothetical protein
MDRSSTLRRLIRQTISQVLLKELARGQVMGRTDHRKMNVCAGRVGRFLSGNYCLSPLVLPSTDSGRLALDEQGSVQESNHGSRAAGCPSWLDTR